uniref:Arginase n=1 Tax=viral metagenome TaxID=1070528 RepID=A0A6C0IL29_9ZZZZ
MLRFTINNFRCMLGQKKNGVQFGGDTILESCSLIKKNMIDVNINKCTDYRKGYNIVKNSLHKGRMNINLGGDHSIAVSTIQPLLEKYKDDLLVIWIDAHADLNTYDASLTKNMHGMPVGALTGLMEHWYTVNNNQAILQPKNIIYVGIRDLDAFERKMIEEKGIVNFPRYTSDLLTVLREHPAKYIHISCDIDGLDPVYMPSTGTPVSNGLSMKHVKNIIRTAKPRLVGFDLVEFNPLIGNKRQVRTTLNNIHKILATLQQQPLSAKQVEKVQTQTK